MSIKDSGKCFLFKKRPRIEKIKMGPKVIVFTIKVRSERENLFVLNSLIFFVQPQIIVRIGGFHFS